MLKNRSRTQLCNLKVNEERAPELSDGPKLPASRFPMVHQLRQLVNGTFVLQTINAPQYSAMIAATGDLTTYVDWLDSRDDDEYDPREYFGKWFDQCRAYTDAYGPYATMSRTKR